MTRFWILGGGRFGTRAVDKLAGPSRDVDLLAVDPDEAALAALSVRGVKTIRADAARFLAENLKADTDADWIIPAVPIHLACEWMRAVLRERADIEPIPQEAAQNWPHPLPAPNKGFFVSHADWLCPDDCPEPANLCTHTGRPRGENLFDLLKRLPPQGFTPAVIRSRQLAPGLGGYRPQDLFEALDTATHAPGPVMTATACRCHGVVHGLRIA